MDRKITLPRARALDFETEIQALRPLLDLIPGYHSPSVVEQELRRCREGIFCIDDTSGLVAFVSVSLPHWGCAALIEHVAVLPNYRRQGLGSLLYQRAEELVRQSGLKRICAPVLSGNQPAVAFFMAQGFAVQSLFPAYCGAGANLAWLDKALAGQQFLVS